MASSPIYPEGPIRTVQTPLYFLKPNKLFNIEKPYAFKFPVEGGRVRPSNMETGVVEDITITDIRGYEKSFNMETNGFAVLSLNTGLEYEDFHQEEGIFSYLRKIELLLKDYTGASRVDVFWHCVRKRHPRYPISTGKKYDYEQPTTLAHCDVTAEEAAVEVRRQRGDEADVLLKKRVQWINIWKPLKGPMNDFPLALCDGSTVNKNLDLEPADLLLPDRVTENAPTYYRPEHKWYYLSSHEVSEVIIFKQSDSLSSACSGVPHCSFANPLAPVGEEPRESIEARALVYYDE
ncbi:hypothetical protein MMC12_003600 [Toensbergia leucococca]|nr:hypothetical protein [Toensbergia leucococca]